MIWDVVIVGAGAAGLVAAAEASRRGQRVLLVEKNRKLGVKILMSGGTRCNITQNTDVRGIIRAFGRQGKFLHSALAAFSPGDVVAMFERLGVETKVESTGKIFPVSDKAIDVRDALVRQAIDNGCEIESPCSVVSIRRNDSLFLVATNHSPIESKRLIITSGGRSYPGCGTTGDGYEWARSLGHTVTQTRPALTPLVVSAPWVRELAGVTIDDVELSLAQTAQSDSTVQGKQKLIASQRGSFLFTHFGISGPAAMNLSGSITLLNTCRDAVLKIDFIPKLSRASLEIEIEDFRRTAGKSPIRNLISQWLPIRLVDSLLVQAGVDSTRRAAEISKRDLTRVVDSVKMQTVMVDGTKGFKKAEVTAGGVCLDEVDSRTMQSKVCKGLFFAGEILDLDGEIGGYNFQSAFSTGWLAGNSV